MFHLCSLAKAPGKPIQVVYVPSHLFHMLFELFKVGRSIFGKEDLILLPCLSVSLKLRGKYLSGLVCGLAPSGIPWVPERVCPANYCV